MNHTKGPWKVKAPQGDFGYEVVGDNNELVCMAGRHPYSQKIAKANVEIIAMALEMKSILEEAVAAYDDFPQEVIVEIAPDWFFEAVELLSRNK